MTASVVAIFTDVVRRAACRRLRFQLERRYAQQALLQERFIPRLESAEPEELKILAGSSTRLRPELQ
jgi:hypothetical protein